MGVWGKERREDLDEHVDMMLQTTYELRNEQVAL